MESPPVGFDERDEAEARVYYVGPATGTPSRAAGGLGPRSRAGARDEVELRFQVMAQSG
jgi:hypothetical protein